MKTFILTFPSSSPLGNGWIEIKAEDKEGARKAAFKEFGRNWAFKLAVAHFLPHDWRKMWLAVWIGESTACVANNANRGLGP